MRSFFLVVITSFLLISCDTKNHEKIYVGGNEKQVDTLDTSFLKLGKLGVIEGSTDLKADDNIIVLNDDQNITFLDQQSGIITISNFDLSTLESEMILVGNKTDQLLLKVIAINGSEIQVKQGNIASLAPGESAKISINATPEIDFKEIAQPTMEITSSQDTDSESGLKIGKTTTGKKNAANLISFKNYELISGDDRDFIEVVGSRLNPTNLGMELEKNGNFKIEIEEGKIEFIPTFRGDFELGFLKVKNLESSLDALIKYKFKIKITTDGKLTGKVSFPLFKDLTFPIRVQAGYVPVYAEVKIEFPAGLSFDIQGDGTYSFEIESEYAFSSQINYSPQNGSDHKSYSDYLVRERKFDLNQTTNNYQFELFVEPKIATNLYKVLGPFANIHTGLQADVKFPLPKGEDDLFFNFNGQVGIQVLDPIWEETLFEDRTPTLFNISRGWDILGPKEKLERNDGNLQDVTLQIDSLGQDNCVGINLRSKNIDRLTTIAIYKNPQFGTIIKDKDFNLNGKVRYCPPANIEGQDSFQITYTTKGKVSNPARMVLNLGDQAKRQAKEINFSRSQTRHTSRGPVQLKVPDNAYSKPVIINQRKIIVEEGFVEVPGSGTNMIVQAPPKIINTMYLSFDPQRGYNFNDRFPGFNFFTQNDINSLFSHFNELKANSDEFSLLMPIYNGELEETNISLQKWNDLNFSYNSEEYLLMSNYNSDGLELLDTLFSNLERNHFDNISITNLIMVIKRDDYNEMVDIKNLANKIKNYFGKNAVISIIVKPNFREYDFCKTNDSENDFYKKYYTNFYNFSEYLGAKIYNNCQGLKKPLSNIKKRIKNKHNSLVNWSERKYDRDVI
jgi:hypothetical protein